MLQWAGINSSFQERETYHLFGPYALFVLSGIAIIMERPSVKFMIILLPPLKLGEKNYIPTLLYTNSSVDLYQ